MINFRRFLYFFCSTCRPNQSRTVRYAFPFILGAVVVLGAMTVASDGVTIIEIVPSKSVVKEGDPIAIDVYVTAEEPVNAIDISVAVPPSQLDVTGIDTGESVITLWTVNPYIEDGVAILRGGTFRRGFVGRHLIATINAVATESGLAYVNVSDSMLLAGDGTGAEITTSNSNGEEVELYITDASGTLTASEGESGSLFEASVQIQIVTDIDGDGNVTLADVSAFMSAWFSKKSIYDFSGDGKMTFRDFSIILADVFLK